MRHGEILNLKWSQFDLKGGFIRLTKADTKEGKAKSVPLNKYAFQALSEIPPAQRLSSEYVFTRKGKTIRDKTDYMRFLCKRAGMPYVRKVKEGNTFHDFRRTAKTFMLKAGVDKVYRDKILDHALQGMDKHYMVVEDEDLKRTMGIFTDYPDIKTIELANVDQNVAQKGKPVFGGDENGLLRRVGGQLPGSGFRAVSWLSAGGRKILRKNYLSIMATRINSNIQINATAPNSNINLSIALLTMSATFIEDEFVVCISVSTPFMNY